MKHWTDSPTTLAGVDPLYACLLLPVKACKSKPASAPVAPSPDDEDLSTFVLFPPKAGDEFLKAERL